MPVCAIKELADSQWHVPARAIKELLDLHAGQGDLSRLRLANLRRNDRNRDTNRCATFCRGAHRGADRAVSNRHIILIRQWLSLMRTAGPSALFSIVL